MALISLIDKVTDSRRHEPDYNSISRLVELVNRDVVDPEEAVQLLHHKIMAEDPNIVCLSLKVLEALFYQCGNIVHRIVCTTDYMSLLEGIMKSTQYEQVQEEILKLIIEWSERFKFFPNYSAPQDLLKSLIKEGYVSAEVLKSTKIGARSLIKKEVKQSNGVRPNQESHSYSSFGASSKPQTDKPSPNPYYNISRPSDNQSMEHLERSADFQKDMEKIKLEQKNRYKKYRKERGLPTSSDEDDIVIDESGSNSKFRVTQDEVRNFTDNDHGAISKKLPRELEILKKQRENLKNQANNVRKEKHEIYKQNCSNYDTELRRCLLDNCDECQRYKKSQKEDVIFMERKLPPEMRKVKQSKKLLNDAWQEVKSKKNREYRDKTSNYRSSAPVNGYKERNSLMISEDEQIRAAIQLSQMSQTQSQPPVPSSVSTLGELDEERVLQAVIERSRLETSYNLPEHSLDTNGEDEIQQAISMSLAESDKANFDAMPDMDEDLQMSFARQLSLDEQRRSLESANDKSDWEICSVCQDFKSLRRFRPCNHKCICDDCLKSYEGDRCVICREIYLAVEFD